MSVEPAEDIFATPPTTAAAETDAGERADAALGGPAVARATDLAGALVLKHDNLYLLTDAFGDVVPTDGRGAGLYRLDTRFLSRYELRVDGRRPVVLRTAAAAGYRGTINLANAETPALGRHALAIVRERLLADALRERIRVTNHAGRRVSVRLTLALDADYADSFEVRGARRERRGVRLPTAIAGSRVTLGYHGLDGVERRTHLALTGMTVDQAASDAGDAIVLAANWTLDAGESRLLELLCWTDEVGDEREAVDNDEPAEDGSAPPVVDDDRSAAMYRAWRQSTAQLRTGHPPTQRALDRGLTDLRLLLNSGPGPHERYVAAGVPWYATLFGRDALINALQLLPYRPQLARDTLTVLARLQATDYDDWRDAAPGKIPHELRSGEMARANEVPHSPYYGSVDATPLWLMLLDEYERWTGDAALVEALWPYALAALDWIERDGDRDGDGFVEYERVSRRGLANQGWKDSADGIRHPDGAGVDSPIALVEVQGYVFAARRGMARLAALRGEERLAAAQEAAAKALRSSFEDAFWLADAGTYALALDGAKRPVASVTSNAGHALWTGLCSAERAERVAASLLSPALWSGWGVRTLSADSAVYNPMAYHLGSVWPHDSAICAAGLARYGLAAQARQVAGALLESAAHFRESRLPELFCGFDRDSAPLPVPYPVACSPQAWSAGAPFHAVTALLGLRPDAGAATLELVAPTLPDFLPELTVANLRFGSAVVDLLVRRHGEATSVDVTHRGGRLDVVVRHT